MLRRKKSHINKQRKGFMKLQSTNATAWPSLSQTFADSQRIEMSLETFGSFIIVLILIKRPSRRVDPTFQSVWQRFIQFWSFWPLWAYPSLRILHGIAPILLNWFHARNPICSFSGMVPGMVRQKDLFDLPQAIFFLEAKKLCLRPTRTIISLLVGPRLPKPPCFPGGLCPPETPRP